jgi:hypothetical protein
MAYISDGLAGNCGDAACTTFGTTVTGGGGALKLLMAERQHMDATREVAAALLTNSAVEDRSREPLLDTWRIREHRLRSQYGGTGTMPLLSVPQMFRRQPLDQLVLAESGLDVVINRAELVV